jgi:hypothetical protein
MPHFTTIIQDDDDPVRSLVLSWWNQSTPPAAYQIPDLRHQLLQAILTHHRQCTASRISYDPFTDNRVLWAAHFLDKIENPFLRSDPHLKARASFALRIPIDEEITPCGKDLAAGL